VTLEQGGDSLAVDSMLCAVSSLIKQGRPEEARCFVDQILQKFPGDCKAHLLLKHVLVMQRDWSGLRLAVEQQAGLGIPPEMVAWNRSLVSLMLGDMPRGWEQFEARRQVHGLVVPTRQFSKPQWKGEFFPDRTLLLHFEQGLGDTLMFVRYASLVKARGGRVLLEVQAPLAGLLTTCPGVDEVIAYGSPLPPFDLQISLMSLPWIFGTKLDSIPADIPYLGIPEIVPNRAWIAETLSLSEGQTRIGLVWAGNSSHKGDAQRSVPSVDFEILEAVPDIAWHSFQINAAETPSLPGLISLDPMLRNMSSTAYALSGMDFVITVDTAIAHLSGALGIPTLLLLPFYPDWRWMLDRQDSPWYPSILLYRQTIPGEWPNLLRQIVDDLTGLDPKSR